MICVAGMVGPRTNYFLLRLAYGSQDFTQVVDEEISSFRTKITE